MYECIRVAHSNQKYTIFQPKGTNKRDVDAIVEKGMIGFRYVVDSHIDI